MFTRNTSGENYALLYSFEYWYPKDMPKTWIPKDFKSIEVGADFAIKEGGAPIYTKYDVFNAYINLEETPGNPDLFFSVDWERQVWIVEDKPTEE